MSEKQYAPASVDTSDIELPEELELLTEKLARNVHETWAQARIEEGWTYGPFRNDELKQHPGLVDFDELPEAEKDYDRITAIGTLKLIIKLGWNIEK